MPEKPESSRRITLAAAVPWILTLAALVVGILQFTATQYRANQLPFLQKQLDLCFAATDAVARLATGTDPVRWEQDRQEFRRLFWGQLGIVENIAVERAMLAARNVLPREPAATLSLPFQPLEQPSLKLAHACRDLMKESWDVRLVPLPGAP